jgi:GGDEF domain-containing protein
VNEPTAELLFHEADQSMYRVKRAGGEGVAVAGLQSDPIRVPVD